VSAARLALEAAGLSPVTDAPLAKLGYWRLGGTADLLVDVEDSAELQAVMATGLPVTVLGNGSNLLIADQGIRGITLRLHGEFRASELGDEKITVGAGLMNAVLLARLDRAELGGLGCLAGVPGTLGGAVRMNAGTRLGEIGQAVIGVDVVLPGGTAKRLSPEDIGFSYRWARLPEGAIITRVQLAVDPEIFEEERVAMAEHIAYRRRTQPLDQPSCGSVFKNPPGDSAGRLIEAVGLKGHRHGGACISAKHANFIVNEGTATAMDVHTLIKLARDTVRAQHEIELEPEVHAVGDWPSGLWPL
jgi:UDP-N-acetylmuramate dehydrogenase